MDSRDLLKHVMQLVDRLEAEINANNIDHTRYRKEMLWARDYIKDHLKATQNSTGFLIDYFDRDWRDWILDWIDEPGDLNMPSIDVVESYLKKTKDDKDSEETINDLVIRYTDDEGIWFDFIKH
jgi:hypothetical protein